MKTRPQAVMDMLTQAVPLTLLWDLHFVDGPDSEVIFLIEEPTEHGTPLPKRHGLN